MKRLFLVSSYMDYCGEKMSESTRSILGKDTELFKKIRADLESGESEKIILTCTNKNFELTHEDLLGTKLISLEIERYDLESDLNEIAMDLFDESELDDFDYDGGPGYEVEWRYAQDPYRDDIVEYPYVHITDPVEVFGIDEVVERVNEVLDEAEITLLEEIKDPTNSRRMLALFDIDI